MNAWNRLTDLRGEVAREMQITKELLYIYAEHMDTDNSVVKAWGEAGAGWKAFNCQQ